MIPGPNSIAAATRLRRVEAPAVNTLYDDQASVVWRSARGHEVVDVDGNRLLDFTSGFGVAALGHRPPRVVRAIRRQLGELLHGLGDVAASPIRISLAERVTSLAPMQPAQVYWAISGSDAVEIAIKTARLATGRSTIVAFDVGYHGLTHGALSVTARESFRAPFLDHLDTHVLHLPWGCDLSVVEAALSQTPVAAVLLEPIPGREGIEVPPPGWIAAVASGARSFGSLVVADEILTGGGRTGTLWACEHERLVPDLLCFGKALGGGLPLAGVLGHRDVLAAWPRDGEALHTATFIAHPLACAAALASLDDLTKPSLLRKTTRLGSLVPRRFLGRADLAAVLQAVRGRGLMWALELRTPSLAVSLARLALERGLLVLAGGRRGTTVQILPPLVIPRSAFERGLGLLDAALLDLARPIDGEGPR